MKAIFFDIDNTLLSFDEYVKQSMKEGFAYYKLKPYEPYMFDVFHQENDKLWRMIEEGTLQLEQLQKIRWNAIFKALDIDFDGNTFETYFRKALYDSAILEPHVIEILDYLKDKYILCVASNGPYEQQCHRLQIGGIYDYFQYYFISEKIGAAKPSKQFFTYAFEEMNQMHAIEPSEAIIIGDSITSDIAGGKNIGMHTCLYTKKDSNAEVEYCIQDLLQLKTFL